MGRSRQKTHSHRRLPGGLWHRRDYLADCPGRDLVFLFTIIKFELAKVTDDPSVRLRAYEKARYPHISLVSRLARRNPANWRIPPLIGRLFPETSHTAMLARFSTA
ncbi:NAD(P)-dependent oxidoreductase [Nonomuraea sp. NEAU-A123]|uniref:NAD(P)-dependent oxidoreductase n=1 Tax=Nonomuraea sp. NEAU-A123 TaxID=2839649 RepID=UPI001BE4D613|nr:NAD(P)-dependent oxidoreductase [Nonomuraea sp. NEAU-A123]MBT2230222.1 hypothetical protein [Nonomuraea sp. NEAU-A123]